MMMTIIEYWSLTGDSTYNDQVIEAIVHQSGDNGDFMVTNQTRTTGNDDQAFWGFAAMSAAELKFKNPPKGKFSYLSLAQGVFNDQVDRWNAEPAACGGGLRWQVFAFNGGYNYKNLISNGCMFSLSARLARYTDNMTYAEQANKHWDWIQGIGMLTKTYQAFDGADTLKNCSEMVQIEWSYNAGVLLHGAANMWNISTTDADRELWKTRVDGLLNRMYEVFFKDGIMTDAACEGPNNCNLDMPFFKGFAARWMAATAQLCPWTYDKTMKVLRSSAEAAVQQCNGANNACGIHWTQKQTFDNLPSAGAQLSVASLLSNLLIQKSSLPLTHNTGGNSESNPNAGRPISDDEALRIPGPATTAERIAGGLLTFILAAVTVGGALWLVV